MGIFDGLQDLDFGSIVNSALSTDGTDVDTDAALTNLVGQLQGPAGGVGGVGGSVAQPATQSSIVVGPPAAPGVSPVVLVVGVLVLYLVLK